MATVTVEPPYTTQEHVLAGLISTQAPFDQMHPVMALPLARFLLVEPAARDLLATTPALGFATTRELLEELRTRIEVDYFAGGGGLDYTTVNGRPD